MHAFDLLCYSPLPPFKQVFLRQAIDHLFEGVNFETFDKTNCTCIINILELTTEYFW